MKNESWYDVFINKLYEKHPQKKHLIEALMEMLSIEREAVYRRLRKEVSFTAEEMIIIASTWNISIDAIVAINAGKVPFQLEPTNYLNPSKEEIDLLHQRVKRLEHLAASRSSEYVVVSNNISRSLAAGFEQIYKFNIFKWSYLYNRERNNLLFANVVIPETINNEIMKYYKCMKNVKNTSYIFEYSIFENIIRDIQFFQSIYLVSEEEKELIKKELHALLDYLSNVAINGCFPETNNKVQIFISMINVNTNYSYFYTEELKTCRIHAFHMHDIYSFDIETIEQFKIWMQLKKRTSILISETDERRRIEFFSQQRQLINNL